jgi:hypothetical protein
LEVSNNSPRPRFSDFAREEKPLDGNKMRIDDLLNQEILIIGYNLSRSKYQDTNYVTIQFERDGNHYVVFTGSQVVADQIEKYSENIPFYATIRKINKYYTLT